MASKHRMKALARIHQMVPLGPTNFIKVHNQLSLLCFITSASSITCLQAGGQSYSAIVFVLNLKPSAMNRTPFLVKKLTKLLSQVLKKLLGL